MIAIRMCDEETSFVHRVTIVVTVSLQVKMRLNLAWHNLLSGTLCFVKAMFLLDTPTQTDNGQ